VDSPWEREGEDLARHVADGRAATSPVRVRPLAAPGVQRYTMGTGIGTDFGGGDRFVEVPKAHKDRVDAGLAIVSRVVNDPKNYPACPKFFETNCPGKGPTALVDAFNAAVIWFNEGAKAEEGGASDGIGSPNLAYTATTYGIGRWAIAASLVHELMHSCGQASHDIGDQAKEACGRLPDITAVSPKITIKNPL
jgi:hypothetical protein